MNKEMRMRFYEIQKREETLPDGRKELWIEGKAIAFNQRTVLFEMDGIEYGELIDPEALLECKMDDVILNYNHAGKVLARTRNKTLILETREDGLYIRARLDGTEEGRKLYEEISGEYIDRMSFSFTIREESYDKETHTWTVRRIKRLYDVSAVDFPAYEDTSVEARRNSLQLEAKAQTERERNAAADLKRRKLMATLTLKTKISQEEKEHA